MAADGGAGGYGAAGGAGEDMNIFIAAGDGLLDVVQSLVVSGVSVNAQDDTGYSAM